MLFILLLIDVHISFNQAQRHLWVARLDANIHFVAVRSYANRLLGCIRKSFASRLRKVILPQCFWWRVTWDHSWVITQGSLNPCETHRKCCAQSWAPLYKRDVDILQRVLRRETIVMKSLQHLRNKERMGELGLFGLEKGKVGGILSKCLGIWVNK